jgi:diguanylate cyclase (GGDEF)-like protein/PAS domain S-box-containing protein
MVVVVDAPVVSPPHAVPTDRPPDDVLGRLGGDPGAWRAVVERSPVVTWIAEFDPLGTLRYVSPHIEALLGHPPEAFLVGQDPKHGGLWERLIHPEDRDRALAAFRAAHAEERDFDCEYRMVAADGRTLHVMERNVVLRAAAGRPVGYQGVLVDVTALRAAEHALRAERDHAQRLLEVAGTFVIVLDPDGRVRLANRRGAAVLGWEAADLAGRDWFDTCVPADDRDRRRTWFRHALAHGDLDDERLREVRVVDRSGAERWLTWHDSILRDGDGAVTGMLSSGVDVTEHRRAEREVAELAYHDQVTGLPNRALLTEHLDLAIARARRRGTALALLYLDLDDFKVVNDSLGHAAGDEVLRIVAARLERRRRAADLLARHGGDEFLLLITDVEGDPEPVARAAAEGLLATFAAPVRLGDEEFHVGASVGLSLFPRDAQDADTLLRHADAAMYQAKGAARGQVRAWTGEDARRGAERLSEATRLRKAIARDELVLHWQPVVRPLDGRVRGVEALVRWEDPERGLVPPAEFIPLAEETGLIDRLGAWVVDAACAQAAAWRAEGHDVVTGINVSARELRRAGWIEYVLGRLDAHGVAPDGLLVELTETTAMRGHRRVEDQLRELDAAGVGIAIDDFGTGWSSLHRLRELPVAMLKLDRSFLRGVPAGAEATSVVRAILELGAALGKLVVAEGVETQRQLDFLTGQGCPLVQGFLLGRPVPARELRLAESRRWRSPSTTAASSPSSSRTGGPARS